MATRATLAAPAGSRPEGGRWAGSSHYVSAHPRHWPWRRLLPGYGTVSHSRILAVYIATSFLRLSVCVSVYITTILHTHCTNPHIYLQIHPAYKSTKTNIHLHGVLAVQVTKSGHTSMTTERGNMFLISRWGREGENEQWWYNEEMERGNRRGWGKIGACKERKNGQEELLLSPMMHSKTPH